jgi:predicted PurR-regulated permease PerM
MQDPTGLMHAPRADGTTRIASGLVIVSFLIALLYLGREVLEPLAIAVLLGFILAPPIRRLRRFHFGRVTSVVIVVGFALAVIGSLGFLMENEIERLANDLPRYQSNLRTKITALNNALVPSGALDRATTTLNNLASELKGQHNASIAQSSPADALKGQSVVPVPVEVRAPQPPTLNYLQNLISPLITPLTMAGLIILFLVFILFYREDLRDRMLRLAGTRDLQRTTEAMNDAGKRLSRFLLVQSAINGCFGIVIGCALWVIGVPSPALWGMLAAILRFVPYVGIPIAAVFPIVLASAVDPGWTMVFATAALFFSAELITGQAIEPVLQGQQTGLSPIAIVIATLFWTLIWGVPGLLLAVPVTACIAVLGKHIDALNFLGVLLGDEPALAPHEGFYQRVLAGDDTEATFQAEERLATEPLSTYYDAVPMKALALAQADAADGKLSRQKQIEFCQTIEEIVEDLADYSDEISSADDEGGSEAAQKTLLLPASRVPCPILLIPARSALDQSASLLLADILNKRGLEAWVQPYMPGTQIKSYKLAVQNAQILCVSYFGAAQNPAHVRYVIRRLRRLIPEARFLACFWLLGADATKLEDWRKKVGADLVATSLKEAAAICGREATTVFELPSPQDGSGAAAEDETAQQIRILN